MWNCVYISVLDITCLLLATETLSCMFTVYLEYLVKFLQHSRNKLALFFYHVEKLNQILHSVLLALALTELLRAALFQIGDSYIFGITLT